MADTNIPPRLLRTPEAARFLGLSPRTLEKHRTYGTGPVYQKLGGRVVYTFEELQIWAARGTRRSTSDPDSGIVYPAKRRDNLPPLPRPKLDKTQAPADAQPTPTRR
jgi:predicted DNA-binding transcriptional regulator AlpA